MRTLIFDTETTGMVNHKSPNHTIQPYPVQLACALIHDDKIQSMVSIIIDPGVPIEEGAAGVHGITNEIAEHVGMSMKAATGLFINFLNKADRIVGHNLDFDLIITEAMIVRTLANYDLDRFRQIPRVCTMLSSTDVCKIPGKYGFKWPKLDEAYKALVDPKGFSGAHDALMDVMACWKVLQKLEERKLPLLRGKR